MGSEVEVPGLFECILILDGRRMGDSAVVKRLLRSELRDDEESVRGGGRFGSVYREDDDCGGDCRCGGFVVLRDRVAFGSAKKSIHVSPSRAFGGCWAK
jgi:hypothetical protein